MFAVACAVYSTSASTLSVNCFAVPVPALSSGALSPGVQLPLNV